MAILKLAACWTPLSVQLPRLRRGVGGDAAPARRGGSVFVGGVVCTARAIQGPKGAKGIWQVCWPRWSSSLISSSAAA
eukprot:3011466-Alexandrium_andersonii.AAC.1